MGNRFSRDPWGAANSQQGSALTINPWVKLTPLHNHSLLRAISGQKTHTFIFWHPRICDSFRDSPIKALACSPTCITTDPPALRYPPLRWCEESSVKWKRFINEPLGLLYKCPFQHARRVVWPGGLGHAGFGDMRKEVPCRACEERQGKHKAGAALSPTRYRALGSRGLTMGWRDMNELARPVAVEVLGDRVWKGPRKENSTMGQIMR